MSELTREQGLPTPDISAYLTSLENISSEKRKLDEKTKERQEAILNNLPNFDELAERLYGHLRNENKLEDVSSLAGELGEILTQAEYDLYPLVIDGRELARSAEKSDRKMAERLLGVLHNPEILIPGGRRYRNPDLAWLDVKNRVVQIIGEVKITKSLNSRSFQQLKPDGFIANIKGTINYLNRKPKYGKEIFGQDEAAQALKGGVSDSVFEVVFLPRDTTITKDNWQNLIKTSGNDCLNPNEAEQFLELFNSGQVKLAVFSFSRREIDELAKGLMARIREKYP